MPRRHRKPHRHAANEAPSRSLRVYREAPRSLVDPDELVPNSYIDLEDKRRKVIPRAIGAATLLGGKLYKDIYRDGIPHPDTALNLLREQHPDIFGNELYAEVSGVDVLSTHNNTRHNVALVLDEELEEEIESIRQTLDRLYGHDTERIHMTPHVTIGETSHKPTADRLVSDLRDNPQLPRYLTLRSAQYTINRS